MIWALAYLASIVLANLSVAVFGAASTPFNAFLLIGATLTLRDKLHDSYGPRVVVVLIPLGTLISLALGPTVAKIALAGACAFVVSELVDTGVYQALHTRPWRTRVNVSNLFSACVDSIIFPVLAFGGFPWLIIVGQFVAKTTGGAIWAWIIQHWRTRGKRDLSGA